METGWQTTETYETTKESVSVEQGQLLRAAKPDQYALYEKAADDPHRRRQDSDLEDASYYRTDTAGEAGIDKVLVNHNMERLR